MKRRKGKGKAEGKGYPKGPEEHSLAKNEHKILNGGQKRTLLGGPKERKARRACQKAILASRRVVLRPYQPDKGRRQGLSPNHGQRKGPKRKRQGMDLSSITILIPRETPMKKVVARPGNHTLGLPVIGLMTPGRQMLGGSAQGLVLDGWWQLR